MTPGRLADLLFYWILNGRDDADANVVRGKLELPPPGYTGSLRGTSWDPDAMLAAYQ